MLSFFTAYAGMAELADALDSGSSESNFMEVQVLLPAPNSRNPNPKPKAEGSDFFTAKKAWSQWEGDFLLKVAQRGFLV